MKTEPRLPDYPRHMQEAAERTLAFTAGMDKAGFLADIRTQQAVLFNFVILGEASTKLMAGIPTSWHNTPPCPGAPSGTCATR